MGLLSDKDRQYLTKEFAGISEPVKIVVFTRASDCEYCNDTLEIIQTVAELSKQIAVETYDVETNSQVAQQYDIQEVPALVIARGGDQGKDFGIRYYGVPAGYEFSSLIHDILMIGKADTGLSEATKRWAAELKAPLHLQVFVTPSCPYCPQAVVMAHKLAMESDWVTADMVEATEFPDLATKYNVMGVPRTVINEDVFIEGAVPEHMLLNKLQEALSLSV